MKLSPADALSAQSLLDAAERAFGSIRGVGPTVLQDFRSATRFATERGSLSSPDGSTNYTLSYLDGRIAALQAGIDALNTLRALLASV